MTSSPRAEPRAGPGVAKRFDWRNFRLRALSAAILIPITLAGVWLGGPVYLVLISVSVALLSVEWGAMSAPQGRTRAAALVLAGVLGPTFVAYVRHVPLAWLLVPLAALAAAGVSRALRLAERPADPAFGVLYLAPPALCLIWLRNDRHEGFAWTLMLLLVCWAADSAAFAAGNTLKGPKLWPRFSPNKTWSGFVAGLVAGVAAAAALAAVFGWPGERVALSAGIGLLVGLATMAGDLWESMLKRRFGVKDSGDLIPGHGGLLDRVDGLMFAALAMTVARLTMLKAGV